MKLAIHYSAPAAELVRAGRVQADYFKCPAWPDLVATARRLRPVYVHFPLRVGPGTGVIVDTETQRPVDWARVDGLLAETRTPFVNVHLAPAVADYPAIAQGSAGPAHAEALCEGMTRDLRAAAERFGPDRVIAENDSGDAGAVAMAALLPGVIRRAVEGAGCGFLLDLSHARLAAQTLGMDARDYVSALPLARTQEIHVTGIQLVAGRVAERLGGPGIDPALLQRYAGQPVDHMPMTGEDWQFLAWSLEQIDAGQWGQPWVAAFEYGGVGPFWEAFSDPEVLADQVPRLYALVRAVAGE